MAGHRTQKHRKSLGESFIEKSKKLYPDQLEYDKVSYWNETSKVTLTCKLHGDFEALPKSHLTRGKCCKECARLSYKELKGMTRGEFLGFVSELHNNFYSYPSLNPFVNNKDTIEIICPKHGQFYQQAGSHKSGRGCRPCGYLRAGGEGSYNNTTIGRLTEMPEATLYMMCLESSEESFFKVGITTKTAKRRASSISRYMAETLQEWQMPLDEAFELEQFILQEANTHKPDCRFGGHTECFKSHAYGLFTGETI